jgi:hypothetical protein
MRNRILAGVGIAALATVGIAAPASAATAGTADLYVVHGVPGEGDFPVDVYANGEPVAGLQDITFGTVTAEPLALPAGDYDIDVFPGDAADGTGEPALTLQASLTAGASVTVVAHLTADGQPALTPFENNVSDIAAGEARLTVRHTAAAPAVDVLAGGTAVEAFSGVTNPNQGNIDLPAGAVDAAVAAAGSTDPLIGPANLPLAAGTNTLVHAIGSLDGDTLDFAVITIDGLGAAPEGVPAGSAGLVAEGGNAGLIGAAVALMLAALAAVGIVVRRQTASAKR